VLWGVLLICDAISFGCRCPLRSSWFYEYNYEAEFPYTPNVRGIRSGSWKFVRYPHGEGDDCHKVELYDLERHPLEKRTLASDPKHADILVRMQVELDKLLKNYARSLDDLPLDEGIKQTPPRF
jgi:N-acetylglucosamine-6-sulfatase